MPRYRVAYTNAAGAEELAYLEGPSIAWVQAHLARKGATAVRVIFEDPFSADGRNIRTRGRLPPIALRDPLRFLLRKWRGWIGVGVAVQVFAWLYAPPGRHLFALWNVVWLAVVFGVPLYRIYPIPVGAEVRRAAYWHEWRRVLWLLPLLEWHPRLQQAPNKYLYGIYRAWALVGLGRLDEGFAALDRAFVRSGPPGSPGSILVARSSLHLLLHQYDEMIALRRRAAAEDPKYIFDAALAMLRYGGEVEEARALLASRDGVAITESQGVYREYTNALLYLADERWQDALHRFDDAYARCRAVHHSGAVDHSGAYDMCAFIDAYRAIAHAALGDVARAEELFRPIEPYLVAQDERLLLARCRAAIAGDVNVEE